MLQMLNLWYSGFKLPWIWGVKLPLPTLHLLSCTQKKDECVHTGGSTCSLCDTGSYSTSTGALIDSEPWPRLMHDCCLQSSRVQAIVLLAWKGLTQPAWVRQYPTRRLARYRSDFLRFHRGNSWGRMLLLSCWELFKQRRSSSWVLLGTRLLLIINRQSCLLSGTGRSNFLRIMPCWILLEYIRWPWKIRLPLILLLDNQILVPKSLEDYRTCMSRFYFVLYNAFICVCTAAEKRLFSRGKDMEEVREHVFISNGACFHWTDGQEKSKDLFGCRTVKQQWMQRMRCWHVFNHRG